MREGTVLYRLAHKLRIPANIVFIAFPILCWALIAFRWSGLWLTESWAAAVIVIYYFLAAAYLFFIVIARMRVIAIIGLFLTLVTCLFMWIPYNWVLAILLVPSLFMAFYKRGNKVVATVLTIVTGICVLFVIRFFILFNGLVPEKYAYHMSPNGSYIALEYAFTMIPGGTDVLLYRVNGLLLVKERVLYLANYSDFGGKIEWLDENTILIYSEKMNVFKDPVIENYDYF